jgi:fructokinase
MGLRFGIDLGGTKIELIALDDNGEVRLTRRIPTPTGDYTATVQSIISLIRESEGALKCESQGITPSVGLGIPGMISPATGLVKNANSTCLIGKPLDRDLEAGLDQPVRLANDADCFALSEATDGAGTGQNVVFGVILGTGVGGGLVVNQRIVCGPNAITGEWGHNPLPWPDLALSEYPGPSCYCGKTGCIETFLSGSGLMRDATREDADPHWGTAEDIARAAERGDAEAQAALDRYVRRLAKGLASVINIIDPDVIILGGGLSNIPLLYERVPKIWAEFVFSDTVATRLLPPQHGDSSGVRGAAWLWPIGS